MKAGSQNTSQRLKGEKVSAMTCVCPAGLWGMAAAAVGVGRMFRWAPWPPWGLNFLGKAFQQSKGM